MYVLLLCHLESKCVEPQITIQTQFRNYSVVIEVNARKFFDRRSTASVSCIMNYTDSDAATNRRFLLQLVVHIYFVLLTILLWPINDCARSGSGGGDPLCDHGSEKSDERVNKITSLETRTASNHYARTHKRLHLVLYLLQSAIS